MQTTGFVKIGNEKILLLIRKGRKIDKFCYSILLKKKTTGRDGIFLEDESNYLQLQENRDILEDLKNGKVIEI